MVCEVFVYKSLNIATQLTKGCGERIWGERETRRKCEGIVKERQSRQHVRGVASNRLMLYKSVSNPR